MLYYIYKIWSQHLFTHIKTDVNDIFFYKGFLFGHSCGGEDNFQEA